MNNLIFKKIGMTRLFDNNNNIFPVTVLQLEKTILVDTKNKEKDGYEACILSRGTIKNKNKTQLGKDKKYNQELGYLYESTNSDFIKNQEINVQNFVKSCEKEYVNVTGLTKGHGFTGVMKRHNFKGLRASHGVSACHRSGGSTGMRTEPGRTMKNTKMAGHYGHEQVTIKNLKIFGFDEAKQCLFIIGSVPGPNKSYVTVKSASVKQKRGRRGELNA